MFILYHLCFKNQYQQRAVCTHDFFIQYALLIKNFLKNTKIFLSPKGTKILSLTISLFIILVFLLSIIFSLGDSGRHRFADVDQPQA